MGNSKNQRVAVLVVADETLIRMDTGPRALNFMGQTTPQTPSDCSNFTMKIACRADHCCGSQGARGEQMTTIREMLPSAGARFELPT
jgi:hypothetical protein